MKFKSGIIAYRHVENTENDPAEEGMVEILHFCGFESELTEDLFKALNEELLSDPEFGLTDGNYELAEAPEDLLEYYSTLMEQNNVEVDSVDTDEPTET